MLYFRFESNSAKNVSFSYKLQRTAYKYVTMNTYIILLTLKR